MLAGVLAFAFPPAIAGQEGSDASQTCDLRFDNAPAVFSRSGAGLRLGGYHSTVARTLKNQGALAFAVPKGSGSFYASRVRRDVDDLATSPLPVFRVSWVDWSLVARLHSSGQQHVESGYFSVRVSYVVPHAPDIVCIAYSPAIHLEEGFLLTIFDGEL